MPPQLLVLRHAKSDWNTALADQHRPLNERGVRAAATMGRFLRQIQAPLDTVISSTALRARSTAELVLAAAQLATPLELDDALYESDVASTLERLRRLDERQECVMIVGHQPTWGDLVAHLTGGSRLHFPTGVCACLDLTTPWSRLGADSVSLRWLVHPKLIAPLLAPD